MFAYQDVLQDRRRVYSILRDNGIPLPTHIIVDRDGLAPGEDPAGFIEEVGKAAASFKVYRLFMSNYLPAIISLP